jgi:hypothetical protein
MKTISTHEVRELEDSELVQVSGGNLVAAGIAVASAFGWGLKFGYTVVGPWLMAHDRLP